MIFPPGHPALALALFYQIWPCPCKCPNGHKNGICGCFYPKSAISCRDCPTNPPKSLCTPPTKSYKFVSANPCKTDAGRINKYDYTGCVGGSFWNFIRFRDFPEALQNLSVIFAHARCHLPCQERLWHSVAFSGKRKSVSSKTKPLCQGLPCQGSCRADARLRGWTKDAFSVSGITQVLLCTTSPSSSLRSMPPPLAGEALAFRDVFQQTQISFIENEPSLPRALLPGELASVSETERF